MRCSSVDCRIKEGRRSWSLGYSLGYSRSNLEVDRRGGRIRNWQCAGVGERRGRNSGRSTCAGIDGRRAHLSTWERATRVRVILDRKRNRFIKVRKWTVACLATAKYGIDDLLCGISIKNVGELLGDYNGVSEDLEKWKEQVFILKADYELDENAIKILIG